MATTPEECLDALREAAERLEESPSKAEYEELDISPSSTTVVRIVGGWNKAKNRAGLKQYDGGERGGISIGTKPDDVRTPDDVEWNELIRFTVNRSRRIGAPVGRRTGKLLH
ncbi:MAG: homing endonuclease associated repeat-containing protein [Haloglomus sp.]